MMKYGTAPSYVCCMKLRIIAGELVNVEVRIRNRAVSVTLGMAVVRTSVCVTLMPGLRPRHRGMRIDHRRRLVGCKKEMEKLQLFAKLMRLETKSSVIVSKRT